MRRAVSPAWVGIGDASRRMGVPEAVLRGAVNAGDLPAYRKPTAYGGRTMARFNVGDLDEWARRSWPRVEFGPDGAREVQ